MATYRELDDLDQDTLTDYYAPPDNVPEWLRVNFVSSADGAVEVDGDSKQLSGPDDMRVFKILRMRCDVLMVGKGTVRTDGYRALRLNAERVDWRTAQGLAPQPVMAVVSRSADVELDTPLFTAAPRRPILITCAGADAARRQAAAEVADVIVAGQDGVDFADALRQLRQRGLPQVLCEGGPHILGELTAADLVDELCLTLSPALAGAGSGRITAGPSSTLRHMRLQHVLHANDNLLLRYIRTRG